MGDDSLIINIIDCMFASSIFLFLLADYKQLHKLYQIKQVVSLSAWHYKLKVIALAITTTAYALSGLYLSVAVSILNFVLAVAMLALIILYKHNRHTIIKKTEEW